MGFSRKPSDTRTANPVPASAPASAPDGPSSSSSSSSSSFSFLSRLSGLSLRSRSRYIADFHIRPAEPHRRYAAGDEVQGAVVLTVVKPVRITHLVVSLHGYMRVSKGPILSASDEPFDPADPTVKSRRGSRAKNAVNGYVRLFQDEQVLSGDGRLDPGRYEFNFNLLFPAEGLPSSIDFERGTISYMITATLTRPPSIGTKVPPKTTCERKILLVERLDIGPLTPPPPSTIYLEPISKRAKKKRQSIAGPVKSTSTTPMVPAADTSVPTSEFDSTRANENSTEGSLSVIGEDPENEPPGESRRPQSEVRSVSGESAASGSTGHSRSGDAGHVMATTPSTGGKKTPAVKERTITATIELPKGGCIPGDTVPVKISVQHIKRIKSMHGVIVTLYRLGRIDSAPPGLSKELTDSEARQLEKEEYYPRSKTGLGGLSLSAAGSCSVYRKDLSQTFAPLIIDPGTLSATLTTTVRVPEDVFPTIKGTPYEMISFNYLIEVIVDLGGKLASQIQAAKPSGARINPVTGPLGVSGTPYDGSAGPLTSWSTSIIDTDRLRRQKGVICAVFEIVVGTTDSSRVRGKARAKPEPSLRTSPSQESATQASNRRVWSATVTNEGQEAYSPAGDCTEAYTLPPEPPIPQAYPYWHAPPPPSPPPPPQQPAAPHYIPPPQLPDESTLTEKERIRRAEERLLPSQPPPASPIAGPSSSSHLPNGDNIYDAEDHPPIPGPSHLADQDSLATPSAPTLEDLSLPPHAMADPNEDKLERERRRLLAEASAPPEFPDDYDGGGGPSAPSGSGAPAPSGEDFAPSAPVLDEDDEIGVYGAGYAYASGSGSGSAGVAVEGAETPVIAGRERVEEPLPRYER
ncbi:hypothetical protein VTJ49DRAFT_2341 [Mycothermus thermophilus]|uniref:Arrestin C-terminal-like domain-containing protein n=1 Tax=Humicola insolens TaxID=85995 RepID=A0ABR3VQV4_HUMIN